MDATTTIRWTPEVGTFQNFFCPFLPSGNWFNFAPKSRKFGFVFQENGKSWDFYIWQSSPPYIGQRRSGARFFDFYPAQKWGASRLFPSLFSKNSLPKWFRGKIDFSTPYRRRPMPLCKKKYKAHFYHPSFKRSLSRKIYGVAQKFRIHFFHIVHGGKKMLFAGNMHIRYN